MMHVVHSLTPLPTPAEMRLWDEGAMHLGLPGFTLMENASRSALQALRQAFGPLRGARAVLFMGGGNNGGDAACLARLLLDEGAQPLLLHTRPVRACTGAAGQHLRLARACGVVTRLVSPRCRTLEACLPDPWRTAEIVVDGLLGTGFHGALREDMRCLTASINTLGQSPHAPLVLALDVPSGLNALTGQGHKDTVRATLTVSFAAAKPGLVLPEARPFTGKLLVSNIGIPRKAREAAPPGFYLLDAGCAPLVSAPPVAAYKNAFGHVLVLGGSRGLTGAPHLAALAALRSGAGLVTAAAPGALSAEVKGGLPDIMTLPCSAPTDETWPAVLPEDLTRLLPSISALALGPGMGHGADAAAWLRAVLACTPRPPAVLDADALNILAAHPDMLALVRPEDLLTPHPGEAGRLLGIPAAAVQRDRQHCLQRLMALAPACWVLKGAGTLVGQRGAPVLISPYDIPTLAVGGSGDVLAGCAASLLPRCQGSMHAALLAVAAHARAGHILLDDFPRRGNLASDIAHALPAALSSLHLLPEVWHAVH